MEMTRKVLVCITPQSNSKRLIDRASKEAIQLGGELHILHVEKGNSLFDTPDSRMLLQELFAYGSAQDGVMHGLCGENVPAVITRFIKKEGITDVVLGSAPPESPAHLSAITTRIHIKSPNVHIIVLERPEDRV